MMWWLAGLLLAGQVTQDKIDLPPVDRRFASAAGGFVLNVRTWDRWKSRKARATLKQGGRVLWERELPQELGPRQVLVTNQGQVLFVDEWINVLSRYALTLVSPAGVTVAQYSADQVIAKLGVERRTITEHARLGPWVTDGPSLVPGALRFHAGGRRLELRLSDGALTDEGH
jgi:hypothetical protein